MIGEVSFNVTARFQDGFSSVKVTAICPYGTNGSKSVSVSEDLEDADLLSQFEVLAKSAIETAVESLSKKAVAAAAQAIVVATQNGEEI